MDSSRITRVRAGQVVPPKKKNIVETPKAAYARWLISQLMEALERNAKVFRRLRQRGDLTSRQKILIELFYRDVVTVARNFPTSGNRIPKLFHREVQQLIHQRDTFITDINCLPNNSGGIKPQVDFVLNWLAVDVFCFTRQFNMNYSSIPAEYGSKGEVLPPSHVHIPNRPSDRELKKKFQEILKAYKQPKGSVKKFPAYKNLSSQMEKAGFSLSERTYRIYKQQLAKGNFENFFGS
jgi:hypothetical protein